MTASGTVAAVDLGATSGRVMLGHVSHAEIRLVSVARFPNNPVRTVDGLHWNILELYRNITEGLASAARSEPRIRSIGVDSWAVDYALLSGDRMLGNPYHYRDERTASVIDQAHQVRGFQQLYDSNGLQFLPFNTLYQLIAEQRHGWLQTADSLLLIPDLVNFWLTGVKAAERTNASTTGLLNLKTREWDADLTDVFGLPRTLLPRLVSPGETVGPLDEQVAGQLGLQRGTPVIAVGSHDTASAVVAVPATTENFAYISSGTWSLVGLELAHPVISESSRAANFTNEGGVDGRVRFLKNVSGLWLLSESIRTWEKELASAVPLKPLLREAAAVTRAMPVFDAGDQRFIAPGDMPKRIADWCNENGLDVPQTPAEFVRSILESLAAAYADALDQASRLAGRRIDVIHVVGGGSQNALLCQLTADAAGVPVIAGPVEATTIGNVLVQARSQGLIDGSLESLRARLAAETPLVTFVPSSPRIGTGRVR
jgi:rhamnulokinase